jgi:hypothetical protein
MSEGAREVYQMVDALLKSIFVFNVIGDFKIDGIKANRCIKWAESPHFKKVRIYIAIIIIICTFMTLFDTFKPLTVQSDLTLHKFRRIPTRFVRYLPTATKS